ncbi:MAG: YchJ family metal-binding protein [Rhodospirillaceae bacterium]
MAVCPCGSGRGLDECCGPLLAGAPAPSAEALMRSRYSAFVTGTLDHIDRSHAREARDEFDRLEAERVVDEAKWLGLEIRRVVAGGAGDETGEVEFVVRYRRRGQTYAQHELASFCREDGLWKYRSGELNPKSPPRQVSKVGRNDACSCGSGKKFKKCCGA